MKNWYIYRFIIVSYIQFKLKRLNYKDEYLFESLKIGKSMNSNLRQLEHERLWNTKPKLDDSNWDAHQAVIRTVAKNAISDALRCIKYVKPKA